MLCKPTRFGKSTDWWNNAPTNTWEHRSQKKGLQLHTSFDFRLAVCLDVCIDVYVDVCFNVPFDVHLDVCLDV
jgi:hypothetical protein